MRSRLTIKRNFACTWLRAWSAGRMHGHPYGGHSSDNLPLPCQRRWCNMPEESGKDIKAWILD